MSVNSSSNFSLHQLLMNCFESRLTVLIFTTMLISYILILFPLLLLIVYLGLQRWRQQRSSSTPVVMSHADFFMYNMAALEMIRFLASGLYCFGANNYGRNLQWVGYSMFSLILPAQTLFHLLTCIERYLAVVHPITYLGLKQAGGVKIRNISTGCVWLLYVGLVGLTQSVNNMLLIITYFGILVFFSVVVCFCTFYILRVLKHPGPGEVSRERERVDQSKQRAFYTVLVITVALLIRLFGISVCSVMFTISPITDTNCAVGSSAMWLDMPNSLVLPLLYLQRAGKLPGCRRLTQDNNKIRAT